MPCPEQHGEQAYRDAEAQGDQLRGGLLGEHLSRAGHCTYLQGQVGQGAHQHEHGNQNTGGVTAKAKRKQVSQRGELIFPYQAQQGHQQDRRQQEGDGHAQINGQVVVALAGGKTDAAVVAPGGGIDTQGEHIGERVVGDPGADGRDRPAGRPETTPTDRPVPPGTATGDQWSRRSRRRCTTAPSRMISPQIPNGSSQGL